MSLDKRIRFAARSCFYPAGENGIDATPLDEESLPGNKNRDVLLAAVERPEVFIAHAEIQVQSPARLPGILEVEVVGVHYYPTLRISYSNGRSCHGRI